MGADVATFIARWEGSSASERQTKDQYLTELCEVLGVARPDPASGDPARDRYVFEYEVRERDAQGKVHVKRIDLYKEGHFLLEAKQGADKGAKKLGHGKRDSNAWHIAMNDAYGQALGYARILNKPVPILVVCDIGYCFDIYESFDGSGAYRHFPTAQTSRLYLRDLAKHVDTLRRIFTDPLSLDPSRKAAKVTREVAGYLADLAKNLESKGHAQETVARFLMRCLFTMFAEDIELLPDHLFTRLLNEHWIPHPKSFPMGVASLWDAMNTGGAVLLGRVRHFNGGLFADTAALPLDEHALRLLHLAATHDWSDVEPAIFGTLLERALNPKERHQLGAHYTPRAYVERLVRPTIEEPIRAEWDLVRAEVTQFRVEEEKAKSEPAKRKKRNEAIRRVHAFHKRLCEFRVLDPACGSGNFLYVALHLFQQIESEIWALLESLGDVQDILRLDTLRVTPAQFLGIEKKRWAKEIAELVLWIGYLQWHYRMLGKKPPEFQPVLHDYRNIENRDAILDYDAEEPLLDEKGKPVTRWDGETTKLQPTTKQTVPDDTARVQAFVYTNPRKAVWPKADFVVGNPPFLGTKRMRSALGDGYVDALRRTYAEEVQDNADLVMYWWDRAAESVAAGSTRRFGLITTNSVTMAFSRRVLERHLKLGVRIIYAIPDHPWTDAETGAAVRIAMTCGTTEADARPKLAVVSEERTSDEDGGARLVSLEVTEGKPIGPDLRVGADLLSCKRLASNSGLASMGVALHGHGFVLDPEQAAQIRGQADDLTVKPYIGGRDLLQVPRERYVIDFSFLAEEDARKANPTAFQRLIDTVLPERRQNRRATIRELWWRFGWERPVIRKAISKLRWYIGTTETAKHRIFVSIDAEVLPDHKVIAIALDDAFFLGILSSRVHVCWALAAGGTLEDRPVYNKTTCFDPFPFPSPTAENRERIRRLAEALDGHRKSRQALYADLTLTGMYNVLEKIRLGLPLTATETGIHEHGLVSVLKKIHDDLDAAVFDAYGWSPDLTDEQVLEKLVALNAERVEEEKSGIVRWLRPDFQNPRGQQTATQTTIAETDNADTTGETEAAPAAAKAWPKKLPEQIMAVRDTLAGSTGLWTAREVAALFTGAKSDDVAPILVSLASLGLLLTFEESEEPRWKAVRAQ